MDLAGEVVAGSRNEYFPMTGTFFFAFSYGTCFNTLIFILDASMHVIS
jgi:hypothetical protein